MTTIHIAAGHLPGQDPGATYHGRTEAQEAKKLVNKAVKLARPHLADKHKIEVIPHNLGYVATVDRFNRIAGNLDLLIEVHFNANAGQPGTGTEVWYGHKATAKTLQNALVKQLGLADRGIKQSDGFYVTRAAIAGGQKSGVIVEMGFINNKRDMRVIDKKGAKALATALVSLSHGQYKALPKTDTVNTDMYKGHSAKYWHNQMKKYRGAWKTESKWRQIRDRKIKKLKQRISTLRGKIGKLSKRPTNREFTQLKNQVKKVQASLGELEGEEAREELRRKELEKKLENQPTEQEVVQGWLKRQIRKFIDFVTNKLGK